LIIKIKEKFLSIRVEHTNDGIALKTFIYRSSQNIYGPRSALARHGGVVSKAISKFN
jgi:hypothetical protein